MSVLFATRFSDHNLNSGGWSVLVVHRIVVKHADPINPNKNTELICQLCLRPMDSNDGLKRHLGTKDAMKRQKSSQLMLDGEAMNLT